MKTYLALLRGINVGGKNIIIMADLKASLEAVGLVDVRTYIQSGNVIFSSTAPASRIEKQMAACLKKHFRYSLPIVLYEKKKYQNIVDSRPAGFGTYPKKYRYDVLFLKKPLTTAKAFKALDLSDGVDMAYTGVYVIYFRRSIAQITKSKLSKITTKPEYQFMTIRNWNTTKRLYDMLNS